MAARKDIADIADVPIARDDFARDVWCLLGLPVDAVTLKQAADLVRDGIRARERLSFVTPNVNWLVTAMKDPEMRRMVIDADLSLIDGAPLVMMAGWLGVPACERVAGSDLFDLLRDGEGQLEPLKIFFFGGRDQAAKTAHDRLNTPSIAGNAQAMQSVGWLNPGFGDVATMSSAEILQEINAADADFLIVALGAAKGQAWIDRNLEHLTSPAIAHLGAVVDFTAGTVTRAPDWMAKSGLEWAWRIMVDRGLWKRYASDAISLAGIVGRQLLPQLIGKPRAGLEATDAYLKQQGDETIIYLKGTLIAGPGLAPVRVAFRKAAAEGKSVRLDLQGAETIDLAFLGLVLMLEKHLTRKDKTIRLSGVLPAQAKLFARNKLMYDIISPI